MLEGSGPMDRVILISHLPANIAIFYYKIAIRKLINSFSSNATNFFGQTAYCRDLRL